MIRTPDALAIPVRRAAIALLVLLSAINVLPEFSNPVWQDEAATLMVYASNGVTKAFSDYSMPNNHMLFSAVLSVVWSAGDDPALLRGLPLVSWVATVILLLTVNREFGMHARMCALALFGASAVAAAFALQLRGYAFSWPFAVAALAAAPRYVLDGRWQYGLLFVLATLVLVATLPTNALIATICAGWPVALMCRRRPAPRGAWRRAAVLLAVPALCLVVYLPHLADLQRHAAGSWSRWHDIDLLLHWILAFSGEAVALLPLVVAGLWCAWQKTSDTSAASAALLCVIILGGVCAAVLMVPTALFPRALIPLLPLWCLALGGLVSSGAGLFTSRMPPMSKAAGLLGFGLLYLIPYWTPPCAGIEISTRYDADLCQQYYRRDYQPQAAFLYLRNNQPPGEPVMLDSEAAWALGFIAFSSGTTDLRLIGHQAWRASVPPGQRPATLVSATNASLETIFRRAGLERPRAAVQQYQGGYFTAWSLTWDD